jgi:hypothetical protein
MDVPSSIISGMHHISKCKYKELTIFRAPPVKVLAVFSTVVFRHVSPHILSIVQSTEEHRNSPVLHRQKYNQPQQVGKGQPKMMMQGSQWSYGMIPFGPFFQMIFECNMKLSKSTGNPVRY